MSLSKLFAPAALVAAVFVAPPEVHAATITLKEAASPTAAYNSAHAHLRNNADQQDPNNAAASIGTTRNVGSTGGQNDGAILRLISQYDLSAIPANATITGVTARLWARQNDTSSAAVSADRTIELHRVMGEIVEDQATWSLRSTGTQWTTPGGDFDPAVLASIVVNPTTWVDDGAYGPKPDPAVNTFYDFTSPALATEVQDALNNSGVFTYMLKLTDVVEAGDERAIFPFVHDYSQAGSSSNRATTEVQYPELIVTYEVPEPSAMVLGIAGIAGAFFLRRR